MVKSLSRRNFLAASVLSGAALAVKAHAQAPHARVRGANEDIRIAVIGVGGKGTDHAKSFPKLPGVRLVAVCDADRKHTDRIVEYFKKENQSVKAYTDLRRVLDDPEIDAITTATPNHWHALIGVWACQAGKHAFIEKPVSHNIWEGRQLVAAARKYRRVVAAGTHNRSSQGLRAALQYLREGNLGKIKLARGFCYKRRPSIGKVAGPQPIPDSVDYNLWCGPAPMEPLTRTGFRTTTGISGRRPGRDIGNQGIHEMDMCRWALGEKGLAPRVFSIGGRFGYDDDGDPPTRRSPRLPSGSLIFEVRGLPRSSGGDAMDAYRGVRIGIVIECEGGYFAGGGEAAGFTTTTGSASGSSPPTAAAATTPTSSTPSGAVSARNSPPRSRRDISPAPSATLANISYRLGRHCPSREVAESVKEGAVAEAYERFLAHLEANGVDPAKVSVRLGTWLSLDTRRERFQDCPWAMEANAMLSRVYRPPFVVPEAV
ncbi:Gfo/Idh/MocA family oxidoreductase [bacterium]|nr:Gfo/Idh/MocA family oxidoreductase [bacterium]